MAIGKLTGDQLRERLTTPPLAVERERGEAAYARSEQFLENQDSRPLAKSGYLQELSELAGIEPDGRYLTQVLERLGDEIQVMLVKGVNRELAMCLAKVQEAEQWAIAHGRKTGSHVVIDRRIFRTERNPHDG